MLAAAPGQQRRMVGDEHVGRGGERAVRRRPVLVGGVDNRCVEQLYPVLRGLLAVRLAGELDNLWRPWRRVLHATPLVQQDEPVHELGVTRHGERVADAHPPTR
jgi:hypothetical protein